MRKPEPKLDSAHFAGTTSTTPQAEQPAVWNPVALDGSVNHSLCSEASQMQSSKDGFAFSIEQLTCPVVIEIFCGSARLTASLKEVGLKDSFGVDHKLDKAVAAAKRLDLTEETDQLVLFQWLQSPLVVGIFLAPLLRNVFISSKHQTA